MISPTSTTPKTLRRRQLPNKSTAGEAVRRADSLTWSRSVTRGVDHGTASCRIRQTCRTRTSHRLRPFSKHSVADSVERRTSWNCQVRIARPLIKANSHQLIQPRSARPRSTSRLFIARSSLHALQPTRQRGPLSAANVLDQQGHRGQLRRLHHISSLAEQHIGELDEQQVSRYHLNYR